MKLVKWAKYEYGLGGNCLSNKKPQKYILNPSTPLEGKKG